MHSDEDIFDSLIYDYKKERDIMLHSSRLKPVNKFSTYVPERLDQMKYYTIEMIHGLVDFHVNISTDQLLYLFVFINSSNYAITMPKEKPRVMKQASDAMVYDLRVVNGVRINSEVCAGYRKLLYYDYRYNTSKFNNFPVFAITEEVFPFDFKVKEGMTVERRALWDDFHYIGNREMALIERGEHLSKEQALSRRMESLGHIASTRYKRKRDDIDFLSTICR